MRLVRNPSYVHEPEIVKKFNLLKENVFYKDHSSYEKLQIINFIRIVELCKTFGLKSESIRWITKQVVDLNLREDSVNEDYIPVLLAYQKHKNKGLKPLFEYVSVVELGYAIQEVAGDKSNVVSSNEFGIIDEHDGWLLTMPYTVEASCSLGSNTVWCTARKDEQNQFFNYTINYETILFYAVNLDKSVTKERKISIGFKDRKLIEGDSELSATVDEDNNPLSEIGLIRIFGNETYSRFFKKMIDKIEAINNEHPLLKKVTEAENDLDLFIKMNIDAKTSLLNRGNFNYEIAKYMQDTYFSESYDQERQSIQIRNMKVAYLINLSYEDIINQILESEYVYSHQKNLLFSSKKIPESIRNRFVDVIMVVNELRDVDFVLNIFSYLDFDELSMDEKIQLLRLISATKFDGPTNKNQQFDQKILDMLSVYNVKHESETLIIANIIRRTYNKDIVLKIDKIGKDLDYDFLRFFDENPMFSEFKIEVINSLRISHPSVSFLNSLIGKGKLCSNEYYEVRDKLISFFDTERYSRVYELNYSTYVQNFVLKNEKDPLLKILAFYAHEHIDFFSDNDLETILDAHNKKVIDIEGDLVFKYSLVLRLWKFFSEDIVMESLLNIYFHTKSIIRADDRFLRRAILTLRKNEIYHIQFSNITITKPFLFDLIREGQYVYELIDYAKEIETPALEYIFNNLNVFCSESTMVSLNISKLMERKNFKADFLLNIDGNKLKNMLIYINDTSPDSRIVTVYKSDYEISKDNIKNELIRYAIKHKITTQEEIQKIINSKKKNLDQMAKSKNLNDLLYVANQKNLTRSIIETLKASRRKEVLDALLDNPDVYLSDLF